MIPNLIWGFWEHTIGLMCSDRCQISQINCFLSSKVARNASFGCLSGQSSNDPSMMEFRPPFFLHGNKRNGTWARALPNGRTVAGRTIAQPFLQGMALILGPEFPIYGRRCSLLAQSSVFPRPPPPCRGGQGGLAPPGSERQILAPPWR